MNNWIVNWCQEKVSSNDNVESIEIIDDIILQISPIELNKRLSNDEKKNTKDL